MNIIVITLLFFILNTAFLYYVIPYSWRLLVSLRTGFMCTPRLGIMRKMATSIICSIFATVGVYYSLDHYYFFENLNVDIYSNIFSEIFWITTSATIVTYLIATAFYVTPPYISYSKEQIDLINQLGKPEEYFVLANKPKDNLIILPNHIVIYDKVFERKGLIAIKSDIHTQIETEKINNKVKKM